MSNLINNPEIQRVQDTAMQRVNSAYNRVLTTFNNIYGPTDTYGLRVEQALGAVTRPSNPDIENTNQPDNLTAANTDDHTDLGKRVQALARPANEILGSSYDKETV